MLPAYGRRGVILQRFDGIVSRGSPTMVELIYCCHLCYNLRAPIRKCVARRILKVSIFNNLAEIRVNHMLTSLPNVAKISRFLGSWIRF